MGLSQLVVCKTTALRIERFFLTRLNIVGLYGITKQNHERAMCNSNPIHLFSLMYVSGSVKSYLLQLRYTLAT